MIRYWLKRCTILVGMVVLLNLAEIFGEPYDGQQFELRQPDGSSVIVKVFGDEYYQRIEDLEGYTVIRNEYNWICYATSSADGQGLVATDRVYTNDYGPSYRLRVAGLKKHLDISAQRYQQLAEQRSMRQPGGDSYSFDQIRPISGKVNGLTFLIDFADEPASIPAAEVDSMMNKPGYKRYDNRGSVRDYFIDVSGGKLDYSNFVLGYYRAQKPKSYYDTTIRSRIKELWKETFIWARDQSKFDFSQVTTDDSSRVISVNILYAGLPAQGWGIGLWPHSSSLDTAFALGTVKLVRYQMTNIGRDLSIGTICHENGHMVCKLPDLYDYQHDSKGVGYACLMCMNDRKIPQPFCAPFLLKLGWITPRDLTDEKAGTLLTLAANAPDAFIYKNKKDSCEFFMIEAKTKAKYNGMMRDEGLYIWHVDTNRTRINNNNWQMMKPDSHFVVSLEQADGLFELERNINMGNKGDNHSSLTQQRFNGFTTPSSKWWNDSLSGLSVSAISVPGDSMRFVVG
ncbi:MAG: M6 family metalloprotease domain-containing protein, partial [Chitinivibrionales bacterium]|nr:M6 family metalloprotease domain-containing protein [Chitinivibrionales bacterium]